MDLEFGKEALTDKFGVVFEQNESIKWTGQPNLKSYILNEIKNKFIGLFCIVIVIVVLLLQLFANIFKLTFLLQETLTFFGAISIFSIVKSIWTILNLNTTIYVVTERNIFIYKDFYNSSIKTIHIQDIKTKELKRSFIDKYFKTVTISLYTGTTQENDGKVEKVYDEINLINDSEKIILLF